MQCWAGQGGVFSLAKWINYWCHTRIGYQSGPSAPARPTNPELPRSAVPSPVIYWHMSLGLCSTLSYPLCISKPVQVIRLLWTTRSHNVDHRASSKLFVDAEHEERTGVTPTRTGIPRGTTSEPPNWTGDERIEDAVLRMLVDKYKPLRTGTIRTAEEKMHRAPPQIFV
jgi:hypothetical protein